MEIKLLGNDTKEKVISDLKEKLDALESQIGKGTKSEMITLVKEFVEEAKADLDRDLELEDRLRVVSTAGQLSREKGTVLDVYDRRTDNEKNLKLATAVIGYGHKTISEHDYLVFGLKDVSRFVEQTLISFRLTSFTIKSGRNVDFRTAGYYVPDFRDKEGNILPNNEELKDMFQKHMNSVFEKYGEYVDQGVPVEEARYALPFGYKTNIVMGCDANEFFRITCELLYGKSSHITELHDLGLEFEKIIKERCPYLASSLEKEAEKKKYKDNLAFLDEYLERIKKPGEFYDSVFDYTSPVNPVLDFKNTLLDGVHLIRYTDNPAYVVAIQALQNKYHVDFDTAEEMLFRYSRVGVSTKDIVRGVYENRRNRELEEVSYTFEAPIELAILPQMTRHRMQSLHVPDFYPLWNAREYLYPAHDEDQNAHMPETEYAELFDRNALKRRS